MIELDSALKAFKTMNFSLLEVILNDDINYMEVSKNTFINRIKERFEAYCIGSNNTYDEVVEFELITSLNSEKQQSFAFISEELPTLKLCFTWNDREIINIQLDYHLEVEQDPHDDNWFFYCVFYEDEKVEFKPSESYYEITNRIDNAIKKFHNLVHDQVIFLDDLKFWLTECNALIEEADIGCPLSSPKYSATKPLESWFYQANNFIESPLSKKTGCFKMSEESNIMVNCSVSTF